MRFTFGAFELDLHARELRCDGEPVAVEPKVFDLLVCLILKRERVVSKEELNEVVWQGRIVSDASLDTCIKAARRAIGDNGRSQLKIRTLPRRGFRFVAAAVEQMQPAASQVTSAAVEGGGTSTEDGTRRSFRPSNSPTSHRLPYFRSKTSIPVTTDLFLPRALPGHYDPARQGAVALRDRPRSSSQFAASKAQEAGTRLAVRYVVQGSVQSYANRVRVNVALVDTVERREVWAEFFDRSIDDVFAVQDEITDAIVLRVQSELELTERRRALLKPLASLTAWSAYHRACWHLDRHSPGDYDLAEQLFKHAAGLDPGAARVLQDCPTFTASGHFWS